LAADNYFSMIPEWVLDAEISAKSVRLYCVLQRYANSHGVCFPSRATLAERCKCSLRTVDQAVDELQAIGALMVKKVRSDRGDWANNEYTVVTSDPLGVVQKTTLPSAENDTTGRAGNDPTGSAENVPLTKAIDNESHTNQKATANAIAREWWEAQTDRPLTPFMALVKILERALKAGYEADRVQRALASFAVVPSASQLEKQMKGIVYGAKRPDDRTAELARRAFAAAEEYQREQQAIRDNEGWDSDEV